MKTVRLFNNRVFSHLIQSLIQRRCSSISIKLLIQWIIRPSSTGGNFFCYCEILGYQYCRNGQFCVPCGKTLLFNSKTIQQVEISSVFGLTVFELNVPDLYMFPHIAVIMSSSFSHWCCLLSKFVITPASSIPSLTITLAVVLRWCCRATGISYPSPCRSGTPTVDT